ncbi:MAG TPA: hypothetical protein PLN21_02835 [Gemmatales bacterium]|nr:hypothetical protein [Gemmatales bacterium]
MIDTTKKKRIQRSRLQVLEGWIERVDQSNRRLHVRTGSKDKHGVCVLIPDHCDIRHLQHHLQLATLLPCDQLSIAYQEDEFGARIAQSIELIPA